MTNPFARSPDLAGSPSRYASIESLKSPSIPASALLQEAPADDTPVLDQLEADNSVPSAAKDLVIRQVLNGRIFSAHLDQRFHNPTLWV